MSRGIFEKSGMSFSLVSPLPKITAWPSITLLDRSCRWTWVRSSAYFLQHLFGCFLGSQPNWFAFERLLPQQGFPLLLTEVTPQCNETSWWKAWCSFAQLVAAWPFPTLSYLGPSTVPDFLNWRVRTIKQELDTGGCGVVGKARSTLPCRVSGWGRRDWSEK